MYHYIRFLAFCLLISTHSTLSWAEDDYNHSFSYLEIGAEVISYAEATSVQGYALDMNQIVINPVQRSGGYTPLGRDSGFYIQTASTLDAMSATESWDIQPFGVVQTNQRKVRWNSVSILYASHAEYPGLHFVTGLDFMTLSFMRSNFQKSTGAPAFEAAISPTTYTAFPGSITEDSTNVSAVIGLRYNSVFLDANADSRMQMGIAVGSPIYYKVENSNFPNATWVEYFHGYDIQADAGYAFRIYKDFFMTFHVGVSYKTRPETRGLAVAGGTGRIPEVKLSNTSASLGFEWGI